MAVPEVREAVWVPEAWLEPGNDIPEDPFQYVFETSCLKKTYIVGSFTPTWKEMRELDFQQGPIVQQLLFRANRWRFLHYLRHLLAGRRIKPDVCRLWEMNRSAALPARVLSRSVDKYRGGDYPLFRPLTPKERPQAELRGFGLLIEFNRKGYLLCCKLAGIPYSEAEDPGLDWARATHERAFKKGGAC